MARSVVVDKGFCRRSELDAFLSSDPLNRAVLTEYLAAESFAGTSLTNLMRSTERLAKFSGQVLILKSGRELAALGPIDPNLRFDMIDWPRTRRFATFCEQVQTVEANTREREAYFLERASAAKQNLDDLLTSSPKFVQFFRVLKDHTGDELLKARRTRASMPRADGAQLSP